MATKWTGFLKASNNEQTKASKVTTAGGGIAPQGNDAIKPAQGDSITIAEMKADKIGQEFKAMHTLALDKIEIGGPKGLEPTRYGDWERAGRCVDF